MSSDSSHILSVNAGSSGVKLGLFETNGELRKIWMEGRPWEEHVGALAEALAQRLSGVPLSGIGHRFVHGGARHEPLLLTEGAMEELRLLEEFDPVHLPRALALAESFARRFPEVPQVACFDTAFYKELPQVARILPVPRALEKLGVRRYGFHGLSYEFLMREVARLDGEEASQGRIVLAHLGSGASLTAVKGEVPVDTSMGFTPNSGMPMSSRSGDLDAGLPGFLARTAGLDAERFSKMMREEAGLLGVSETSADMHHLLSIEREDPRAQEAIALFCFQAKKWVGALSAAMGGLDALVFAGGIGEKAPSIRSRICEGLAHLGVELDPVRNDDNAPLISKEGSRVRVRAMTTDEEHSIAEATKRLVAV